MHGARGVGKQRVALAVGQTLLCEAKMGRPCGLCQGCRYSLELTHPDLYWVFPRPRLRDADPSDADVRQDYGDAIAERVRAGLLYGPPSGTDGIYVATARWLVHVAALTPALARRKVIVIGDAERMVPQEGADAAANAVLKLLEEPPADTMIMLTSSEPNALLPTIRSRLVAIRVPRVSESDVQKFVRDPLVKATLDAREVPSTEADRIRLAHGAPGRLLEDRATSAATAAARALLEAADTRGSARYVTALHQGSAGARGAFADTLDALTVLLHARAADAARRNDQARALAASAAIAATERAKEAAEGNVSPQLVAAALVRSIGKSSGMATGSGAGSRP